MGKSTRQGNKFSILGGEITVWRRGPAQAVSILAVEAQDQQHGYGGHIGEPGRRRKRLIQTCLGHIDRTASKQSILLKLIPLLNDRVGEVLMRREVRWR